MDKNVLTELGEIYTKTGQVPCLVQQGHEQAEMRIRTR